MGYKKVGIGMESPEGVEQVEGKRERAADGIAKW